MVTERTKLRIRIREHIGKYDPYLEIPAPAQAAMAALHEVSQSKQAEAPLHIHLSRLPKSLNSQYIRKGRRSGQSYDLDPEIKELRDEMFYKLCSIRSQWKPKGVLAVVIVFRSSQWVTKEHLIRTLDIDNKIKPLLDAFEKAIQINDTRFWQMHVFKSLSQRTGTDMFVYDLGDIVDKHVFMERHNDGTETSQEK